VIHMLYTSNGVTQEYTFPPEKHDEIMARADAKFLPPWTGEDEIRFQEILRRMKEQMKK